MGARQTAASAHAAVHSVQKLFGTARRGCAPPCGTAPPGHLQHERRACASGRQFWETTAEASSPEALAGHCAPTLEDGTGRLHRLAETLFDHNAQPVSMRIGGVSAQRARSTGTAPMSKVAFP